MANFIATALQFDGEGEGEGTPGWDGAVEQF